MANINSRQEEEQQDVVEGREDWTTKEGERRTLEEGREEIPDSAGENKPCEEEHRGIVTHLGPKSHKAQATTSLQSMKGGEGAPTVN